jgi:hypothetical protein
MTELARLLAPEPALSKAAEQTLAPLAQIFEEDVTEDDMGNALALEELQPRAYGTHVVVIAIAADVHLMNRNADRLRLSVDELLADGRAWRRGETDRLSW